MSIIDTDEEKTERGRYPAGVARVKGHRPKILLVGEQNPYGRDPAYALFPHPERSAGARLCREIMGISRGAYLRQFARVNLCADKWSMREARIRADELMGCGVFDSLVLFGARVSAAFGAQFEVFSPLHGPGPSVLILPHPSGRCRLWNHPDAIPNARASLAHIGAVLEDA